MRHLSILSLLSLSLLVCSPADHDEVAPHRLYFDDVRDYVPVTWGDLFTEKELKFNFGDDEDSLSSVGALELDSMGNLAVLDGKRRRIVLFDSTGTFIRFILNEENAPRDSCLPGLFGWLRGGNAYYVFDLITKRLYFYSYPECVIQDYVQLRSIPVKVLLDEEENIVTYALDDKHSAVLTKYDRKGIIIKEAFSPLNRPIMLFLKRFQLGGITDDGHGQHFYMVYPATFKILRWGYDLKMRDEMLPSSFTKFRPNMSQFPDSLSPFMFSPLHAAWWDQFLHVARIYTLTPDLLLVHLFESHGITTTRAYVNVYDTLGRVVCEGLEVPRNGIIRNARNGIMYVVVSATINREGMIEPVKLFQYRLRNVKSFPQNSRE